MVQPTITIVEMQLDWLTLTAKSGPLSVLLAAHAHKRAVLQECSGDYLKPFTWKGYAGEHCGPVTWGVRKDGAMAQFSGPSAGDNFDEFYPLADHATRVDLQVTCRYEPFDPALAWLLFSDPQRPVHVAGTSARWSFQTSDDGGATVYIGKYSSDQLARLYDKGAESSEPGYDHCWRFELQLKSTLAARAGDLLYRATDRQRFLRDYVYQHFTQRGLCPGFDDHTPIVLNPVLRPATDAQHKLDYLAATIAPLVSRLTNAGYAEQAITALGLDPVHVARRSLAQSAGYGHHRNPFAHDDPLDNGLDVAYNGQGGPEGASEPQATGEANA